MSAELTIFFRRVGILCLFMIGSLPVVNGNAAVTQAWSQRKHVNEFSTSGGTGVVVDYRGNIVVIGFLGEDFYTAKYSVTNGALLWQKTFDGAGEEDYPGAIAVDQNGNVFVTGGSYKGTNNYDFLTLKYAANDGALLWQKRYQSPNGYTDIAWGIAVDGEGNAIVTGESQINGGNGFYTVKYSGTNGTVLWEKRSAGAGMGVAVDANNNVVVIGVTFQFAPEYATAFYTAKYAGTNGAVLWEKSYAGINSNSEEPRGLALDAQGNVIVTGFSTSTNEDYYTVKYAATDGTVLWEKRFNGDVNGSDYANAVAVDPNGDVVVTGYSWNGQDNDYYTVKYAGTNGSVLWGQRFNNGASRHDIGRAVKADALGNIVVTGDSAAVTNGLFDYCTIKYAGTNGALLWQKRYNGPANWHDVTGPGCLAVVADGSVAVTGKSDLAGGSSILTVLYGESLPPLAIDRVPTGKRLRFPASAESSYQLEWAPGIAGPWSTNSTITSMTNQVIEYIDTNDSAGARIYRLSRPE
jgi:hypothetical protein